MTPFYYYYDTHTPDINDIISLDDSMQAKTASGSWEILSDDGGADHITLSELRRNVEFEEKHLSMSSTISLMVIDHCLQDFITVSYLLLISDISPQFWHFAKPVKNGQFWRPKKLIWGPKKKSFSETILTCAFCKKKWVQIGQIWPVWLHIYFTSGYRGFPLCTLSQHPVSRETGYSNVLGFGFPYHIIMFFKKNDAGLQSQRG